MRATHPVQPGDFCANDGLERWYAMQTSVRYTVINQDGRPVIRAVPVPSRLNDSLVQAAARGERQQAPARRDESILRRIRRLRLLDIR